MEAGKKPNFVIPSLATGKLKPGQGPHGVELTTREEQEQYKLKGMQDEKVKELIDHEKRGKKEDQDSSDNDVKQQNQDKKKKRKKRKKKAEKVQEEQKQEEEEQERKDPTDNERFKHNIMASHDL